MDPFDKPDATVSAVETKPNEASQDSEKSPRKRGRKPGSKNKPKSSKGSDENVDPNNKPLQPAKKKKNMSKVEELLDKFKGPFVHIDGSFRSPNFVSVVNSANDSLKPTNLK